MTKKKSSRKNIKFSGKKALIKSPKSFIKPSFLEGPIKNIKIRVIGVGGGGSSIVSEIARKITKASFAAANTDIQALKSLPKEVLKFHFGEELTHGLGTGMNAEIARVACERDKEKIARILQGKDLCILVATLGGGVASGASPVFAEISRNLKNINFGIFTLPFSFEGKKKLRMAKASLEKLRGNVNALVVIPNERIFQIIDKKTPLNEALSEINKTLRNSLVGLIEIIFQAGFVNLDFADLRTILQGRGRLAYLHTIEIPRTSQDEGKFGALNKIDEIIKKLLNDPLYPYNIKGAKAIIFNISGGSNLSLDEVSKISNTIYELVSGDAKIIFGVSHNKQYEDKIKITLLATGCRPWIFPTKKKKKQQKETKEVPKEKETKFPEESKKKTDRPKKKRKSLKKRILVKQENSQAQKTKPKIRRSALEIKKKEEDILSQEEVWETPAFLREEKEE